MKAFCPTCVEAKGDVDTCRAPNGEVWVCEYGHPLMIEGCPAPKLWPVPVLDTEGRRFFPVADT